MRRIRLQRHNLLGQILRKEHLPRRDRVIADNRPVRSNHPVGVHLSVDVDRALDVEAREDGLHLHHAVGVRGPHSAEPGRVACVEVEVWADGLVEGGDELFERSVGVVGVE